MNNRRRRYITDKRYQWRTVLNVIGICAAGLLVNLSLFNFLSYRELESLQWKSHIQAASVGDIIRPYLIYTGIFCSALTVLSLFLFVRHLMRKTAGPLYRLKKEIEKAAQGDLSVTIYLRKADDFKDAAEECNRAIESLRNTFSLLKERFLFISRTLDILEYAKDKGDVSLQKCKLLKEAVESLHRDRK
jgi:methyl-accepting chemotaxis protein